MNWLARLFRRAAPQPVVTWIASAVFYSVTREDGPIMAAHVCIFAEIDGARGSIVNSSCEELSAMHSGLLVAREMWRLHGDLPECARCISAPRSAELIVFPGGRDVA